MYEKYWVTWFVDDCSYPALHTIGIMGTAKGFDKDRMGPAGAAICFYRNCIGHCGMAGIVDGAFPDRLFQAFYDFTAQTIVGDIGACRPAGDHFFPEKVHRTAAGNTPALAGGNAGLPDCGRNSIVAGLYQGLITCTNDF
jgi:hypothetical protein